MPSSLTRRRILAVAGVVLGGLSQASAQILSNASCLSTYEAVRSPLPNVGYNHADNDSFLSQFYNSKGQIPCLVAAYLGGACNGGGKFFYLSIKLLEK